METPTTPTKKIYKQMSAVLADIDAIEKTRKNTQGSGYNFRGIDDVFNEIHPIFAKHSIFAVPIVIDFLREERKSNSGGLLLYTVLTVKYTFYADDGSSVDAIVKGEAFDSGDKSCNKAMSAAMKYAILQTFCIPTIEDKDTESSSPQVAPRDAKAPPRASKPSTAKPPVAPNTKPATGQPAASGTGSSDKSKKPATEGQRKLIWARLKNELSYEDDYAKEFIIHHTGRESSKDLTMADVDVLLNAIDTEVGGQEEPGANG